MDTLSLPRQHAIPGTARLNKALYAAYELNPRNFEELLQVRGVGPGTLRALALVAEVTWGAKLSFADPVRYSFAHGGKDGFPFPVNEKDIENSYVTLQRALKKSKAGKKEQMMALKKLSSWYTDCHQAVFPVHTVPYERQTGLTTNSDQPPTSNKAKPVLTQPQLFN